MEESRQVALAWQAGVLCPMGLAAARPKRLDLLSPLAGNQQT
jgi:hypothetical protein